MSFYKYDEFDDPGSKSAFSKIWEAMDVRARIGARGPGWAISLVVGTVAVLAAILWYSYPREAARQEMINAPILRADAGPYKIVPKEPGGMDIPYRDSTVFETLRADRGDDRPRIENLLPEAEEPLSRETLFAGLKTEIGTAEQVEQAERDFAAMEKEIMEMSELEIEPESAEKQENAFAKEDLSAIPKPRVKPVATASVKKMAAVEPASGPVMAVAAATGRHLVQLGSLKSHNAAEATWQKLQTQFPAQLKDLSLKVQEADLGERGTFYRVQAGPMEKQQARAICAAVRAKKPGGCLVIKR